MKYWIDYKIFSLLFLSPRYNNKVKEMLEEIKDRPYYGLVKEIIKLSEQDYNKIATEFTSCFINDYKHVKCPPYESWYKERTVLGSSVEKVMEEYLKFGIYPKKQLADHLSTELEFVSFLLNIDKTDEAKLFLTNHILTWVPKLVQDILTYSKGDYTRLLGTGLKQLLETNIS
ncbi:MAG: molecular chaperone TorD family protein [Sulfolobus sp.]|nr:molecular chaperone TorD family protein [Sulfolobus sp.]